MSSFLLLSVRKLTPALALTALLAFACSVASQVQAAPHPCPPEYECLSSAQQGCMNAISKRYLKLSFAYGKEISKCIRKTSSPLSPVSLGECVSKAETRPKVIAAQARLLAEEAQHCTETPPFGFTSGAVANQAALDQELELLISLFGSDLDAAVPSAQSKCQRKMFRQIQRCQNAGLKAFNQCKKDQLEGLISFDGAAENLGRRCLDRNVLTEVRLTGKPRRVYKACRRGILDRLSRECGSPDPEVLSLLFPGECSGPTDRGFMFCILERVRCRICLGLTTADGLPIDCDLLDDFNPEADGSCP